jgi:hypothetical protein
MKIGGISVKLNEIKIICQEVDNNIYALNILLNDKYCADFDLAIMKRILGISKKELSNIIKGRFNGKQKYKYSNIYFNTKEDAQGAREWFRSQLLMKQLGR